MPLSPNSEAPVHFTVLIPTRQRCDTLEWTLRTCVAQNYTACRFVVSDNASTDDTRKVVQQFADPRIVYVNTGRRLSMSENWEYALRYAGDGYVTYIGDDDGLLPNALVELDGLLRKLELPSALAWRKAEYVWPQFWLPEIRNLLTIPLRNTVERRSAPGMLHQVANWQAIYLQLPCLYNSFVRKDVIRRATGSAGVFFHSSIPDVYSAVALASVVDTYYYSHQPYSINGASQHSTGSAHFIRAEQAENAQQFLNENTIPFHPELAMAPSAPIMAAEAFLQVRDHVPDPTHLVKVDIARLLEESMRSAAGATPEVYAAVVGAVRIIAAKHQLDTLAAGTIEKYPHRPGAYSETVAGYNVPTQTLSLFADAVGAHNIYDAALVCKTLMVNHRMNPMSAKNLLAANIALAPSYWHKFTNRVRKRIIRR